MNTPKKYALEAIKITFYCLLMTGFFKLLGASNSTLLVVFNMAVMSAAATFSVEKKHLNDVVLGSAVIVTSIILGGIIGYYAPRLAILLTIVYAGLAFYLPKTKMRTNIFVTAAVMFLIFSSLPFAWRTGLNYGSAGVIVIATFSGFYFLFEARIKPNTHLPTDSGVVQGNKQASLIVVFALVVAWIIRHFLSIYTSLSHLYWVALTVLMVIQGSQQKTISTSLKRIGVNAVGALFIVLLFGYLMPVNFWINFSVLVLFLFLIFFLSFSYVGRTLFIELFVLGFAHLLGDYHNVIALDRIILTGIGGIIVIIITLVSCFILRCSKSNN